MKDVKTIATGKNYTAADFGKFNELSEYVLDMGTVKIPGKIFGGQAVNADGGQFSFQVFQPGQESGFYHTHKNHEELYFFLSGHGEFQADGENIAVQEGSVVRAAPDCKRTVRNNGTEPLVMLCVQYRGGTFTSDDADDGIILNEPVKW